MKGVRFFSGTGLLFAAGIFALMTGADAMARPKAKGKNAELLLAIYHQPSTEAATQKIEVKESEWQLEPNEFSITAGKIEFKLKNVGTVPHALSIEGHGVHASSLLVDPGKTASLEVELTTTGDYKVICPLPGHAERGMVGKLTVKKKAPAGAYTY